MNKEWSELNKKIQHGIGNEACFSLGIETLIKLRDSLFKSVESFFEKLSKEDFSAMPYINTIGYHNKTIAYSIWHVFRIEDIVVNSLLMDKEQIFFAGDYKRRTNAGIITTGNELIKNQIADFSKCLVLKELLSYAFEVKENTDQYLQMLSYSDMKQKIDPDKKKLLKSLHVVSEEQNSIWLIDYWCNKDIRGLIKMPLSRHWIMHIEASLRIASKLSK